MSSLSEENHLKNQHDAFSVFQYNYTHMIHKIFHQERSFSLASTNRAKFYERLKYSVIHVQYLDNRL